MSQAKFGKIDQIGIIVDDIDKAIESWMKRLGMGPWMLFRGAAVTGHCRGEATRVTFDVAMGYQGDTQIELMQITSDSPSPYRDSAGNLLFGMHHIAWVVPDLGEAMKTAESEGLKLVFHAGNEGTQVAYFEMPDQPGMMYEFIESPATRAMMDAGIEATRNWDGSNPITEIDMTGA